MHCVIQGEAGIVPVEDEDEEGDVNAGVAPQQVPAAQSARARPRNWLEDSMSNMACSINNLVQNRNARIAHSNNNSNALFVETVTALAQNVGVFSSKVPQQQNMLERVFGAVIPHL